MLLLLPQWFVQGYNATLKKVSYLENFPTYMRNSATINYNKLLNELTQRNFSPYSASMIRYALNLCLIIRYTSCQAYRLSVDKCPVPSLSLLNKIQQGVVDASKALKTLYEKGSSSNDEILIIYEMYLQKSA